MSQNTQILQRIDRLIAELQQLRNEVVHLQSAPSTPPSQTPLSQLVKTTHMAPALDDFVAVATTPTEPEVEPYQPPTTSPSEPVMPVAPTVEGKEEQQGAKFALVDTLSLLDNYFFANELFHGNQAELKNVLLELEKQPSMEAVEAYLYNHLGLNPEENAVQRLVQFIEQNSTCA